MPATRWKGDQYILDNTIVGCVQEDAFNRGWWAYGCDLDWQDSPLGLKPTLRKAEQAVEQWVKDRS